MVVVVATLNQMARLEQPRMYQNGDASSGERFSGVVKEKSNAEAAVALERFSDKLSKTDDVSVGTRYDRR